MARRSISRFGYWLGLILLTLAAAQPGVALGSGQPPSAPGAPQVVTVSALPPNIRWGGRATAITVNPNNRLQAIVASESGGLFKTTDGGNTWFHLNNLPMFRMTDVRYAPSNPLVVIATGWSDSHVGNQGGLWRSPDGGATWSKPATSNPPAAGSCPAYASAWGIAFEPGSNKVYVGTDCGLAISTDLGLTWPVHVQTVTAAYRVVSAMTAAAGGALYLCGPNGFQWSSNGGGGFSNGDVQHACSSQHGIAVSNLESSVVFVARHVPPPGGCEGRAAALFEGDLAQNGTVAWTQVAPTRCLGPLGRDPWVKVNRAENGNVNQIDVWYSDGLTLFHRNCPRTGGPGTRCGPGTAGWIAQVLSHSDENDMAFDPAGRCPLYVAHDGGLDRALNPGLLPPFPCATLWLPDGAGPGGYNAQQIYSLAGQIGPLDQADLYIGTQDNGMWASPDRGGSWPYACCNEGGGLQLSRYADATRQVTFIDFGSGTNLSSGRYLTPTVNWRNPLSGPAADVPIFLSPGVYVEWKQPGGVTSTLSITTNGGNFWNDTPAEIYQGRVGSPKVVFSGDDAVIYQIVMNPIGGNELMKIRGIHRDGSYAGVVAYRVGSINIPSIPPGEAAWSFQQPLGVDPWDPNHLIAADLNSSSMKVSISGGLTWTEDTALTNLVLNHNAISNTNEFLFAVTSSQYGSATNPPGTGSQAHVIAFDPFHRGRVLVGTEAAGLFLSYDGGANWTAVPNSRQVTGVSDVFFIENSGGFPADTAIVATYGRGLWRLTLPQSIGHPFDLSDATAGLWAGDWVRDPSTGDLIDPDLFGDPAFCPPCRYYVVRKGQIHDLTVDNQGILIGLNVSNLDLLGSTADGFQFPPRLALKVTGSNGSWGACGACVDILAKPGGVIKGVVTDGDGQLLAFIGSTGDLPDEDLLWPTDPIVPTAGDPYAAPTEPYLVLVTDHLFSQPTAAPSDDVMVYGFNFCSGGPCSPISLTIGNRLLTSSLVPDAQGSFKTAFTVQEPFGYYPVTAAQTTAAQSVRAAAASNSSTAWLAVGVGGDETDDLDSPHLLWLPLVGR